MNFEERYRILTIDDEPNLTDLVRLFLEKTKRYVVFVENRSGRALNTARAVRPDLILLDVSMPGYDGGDIARKLGEDGTLQQTPILFFTSLISHVETGGRAVERAGQRFLPKPLCPKLLVAEVDRFVAETRPVPPIPGAINCWNN